jgi:hypothetical protein
MRLRICGIRNLLLLATAISPAFGATINWTTWTAHPTATSVDGTLTVGSTPVSISYSGEVAFAQLNGTGANFYQPLTTFTAPPAVTNAPPPDMIAIDGTATNHVVTFGTAVVDPVMEIVSLGRPSVGTQYSFSLGSGQSMSILAQGPSSAFGGCNTCLTLSGSTITGFEGDGLIQFTGTFSSLNWTGANPEFWNGITFGVTGLPGGTGGGGGSGVPEPATWGTILLALVAGAGVARARRRA